MGNRWTLSRTQQWLTAGFGVLLLTLLGMAMLAQRAIVNRADITVLEENDEDFGYLLEDIAEAEAYQQQYFETQNKADLQTYKALLNDLDDVVNDFQGLYEGLEESSALREFLVNVQNYLYLLQQRFSRYEVNQLDPNIDSQLLQEIQTARTQGQLAWQAIEEEQEAEQERAELNHDISRNNDLWLMRLGLGLGLLTLGGLYVWLMRASGKQTQQINQLRQANQVLAQDLTEIQAELQAKEATLDQELSLRQEIETTYKAIEEAKELTDLKLNFFSLASHELRTPLSAILVSAQLLDNPNAIHSEVKRSRNLRRIQSAAKTMTQLLADILLLTRAEAGKLEFSPQTFALETFCQKLIDEVKFNTQAQHQIVLHSTGPCEKAHLDEKLLRAMLMSLLTNAIKYSPSESEVQFTIIGETGNTRFRIQDQGIGIPDADQKRLFESFHRGQNVSQVAGTGLGLAVVKKCLDLHGGTIQVESQVGMGTRFTVDIPWADHPVASLERALDSSP